MSGRTGRAAWSTWSTSRRTNQVGLLDAPSTRSSTPTPVVPPPGRDTPQRRYLGLTRNSTPRSFWGLPGPRANEVEDTPERGSDFECPLCVPIRACYELGQKPHRNADSTLGLGPSRFPFFPFLSRF